MANHETTIRESKLNNTEYFYDNTSLQTTSEKIFFKWCKELNLIDFEPAVDGDEYFGNLTEFERLNANDDTYFPEVLWKEREVTEYNPISFYQSGVAGYTNNLEIELSSLSNFKVGDKIIFSNISNTFIDYLNGTQSNVLYLISPGTTQSQKVVLDIAYSASSEWC